jgi:hypothetical protein
MAKNFNEQYGYRAKFSLDFREMEESNGPLDESM